MVKYHYNVEQGTEEWYQLRLGVLTGSNIKLIMTPSLTVANNDKLRTYVYEIAAQRLTQHLELSYQSRDMERGSIEENIARQIYNDNICPVKECGFITDDRFGFTIGVSPDGLLGENAGIEIKSRRQKYQVSTVVKAEVPKEYILQIQTNLLVTGREWWDYVQYSNGMPLFVKTIYPDLEMHDRILEAAFAFEEKVKEITERYQDNIKGYIKTERRDIAYNDKVKLGD